MFEANRSIDALDPVFRPKVRRFLQLCTQAGIHLIVTETKRSRARQFYLWCKGRVLDRTMEQKYLGYIDPNIKGEPSAAQVTWTLSSRHVDGLAIDVCPMNGPNAWWTAPASVWDKIYDMADTEGIKSMYRLYGKDRPHLSSDGN